MHEPIDESSVNPNNPPQAPGLLANTTSGDSVNTLNNPTQATMQATTQAPPLKIVSLGYRCPAAGIAKLLGRKTESHPFDWMISRLPIVQHCIETDFQYFMDPDNYAETRTMTAHYDTHEGVVIKICDETIQYNTYYEEFPLHAMHTTEQLTTPRDTYAYHLATNHHSIKNPVDKEYYARCVGRFRQIISDKSQPVLFIYIHQTLTLREFQSYRSSLIQSYLNFANFLQKKMDRTDAEQDAISRILFIVPVRTPFPYPITNRYPDVLETLVETPNTIIKAMYANRDFVDAGEIFMRNAYIECDTLCYYISTLL